MDQKLLISQKWSKYSKISWAQEINSSKRNKLRTRKKKRMMKTKKMK